jgi:hypothetical protein
MATVLEAYATEEKCSLVRFSDKMTQCKGYLQINVSRLVWEVFVA